LIDEGRILLCHRAPDRRWYPDVWDLPGGHVEPGESPGDALKRELREELGVIPQSISSEPVGRLRTPGFDMSVWRVLNWAGVVQNAALAEHDDIGWFTSTELPGLKLAHASYTSLLNRMLRS
jgi:8-oxo-dGTP diphosphatase